MNNSNLSVSNIFLFVAVSPLGVCLLSTILIADFFLFIPPPPPAPYLRKIRNLSLTNDLLCLVGIKQI